MVQLTPTCKYSTRKITKKMAKATGVGRAFFHPVKNSKNFIFFKNTYLT